MIRVVSIGALDCLVVIGLAMTPLWAGEVFFADFADGWHPSEWKAEGIRLGAMPKTFCNPLSFEKIPVGRNCRKSLPGKGQYRELADPTLLWDDGALYCYPSVSMAWKTMDGGASWRKINIGIEDVGYAPTVVKHRGLYYLIASGGPLYIADSAEGPFRHLGFINGPHNGRYADPMLFSDDDGRLYLYHGCTPTGGIQGFELDAANPLRVVGDEKTLVSFEPEICPWECVPSDPTTGWVEGGWMVKVGKRYCLTYSAAGASNEEYAMGAAWSDSPLGSFVKQANNPFFRTTAGLVRGTGHGSIVHDPLVPGSYLVGYCVVVGTKYKFERLVGMDRIRLDANGEFAAQHASDTPQFADGTGATPWKDLMFTAADRYEATDGKLKTFSAFETLPTTVVFRPPKAGLVRGVRTIWYDVNLDEPKGVKAGPVQYRLEGRGADGVWQTLVDASANTTDLKIDYRETPVVKLDELRMTVFSAPSGLQLGLAELTVFGTDG